MLKKTDMDNESKEFQDKVAELQIRLEASQKSEKVLQQENDLLKASVEAHQKRLAEVYAEKEAPAPQRNTFEHDGKEYEFLVAKAKVPHEGEVVELSAADILATPEVLSHLVAVDSGLIREVK